MDKFIKILFTQKISDLEFETESIWCQHLYDNKFLIDNIPFVAKNIAFGDIILAEFDKDDNQYHFEDFNTNSGNTTVRIFVYDDNIIEETRNWLHIKSCESEVLLVRNIIAVSIPKNILYGPIKLFVDQGERENKWTYEESCLEHSY